MSHYGRNLCHIRCLVKLVTLTSISLYDFTLYGICFFFINLRLNLAKTKGTRLLDYDEFKGNNNV